MSTNLTHLRAFYRVARDGGFTQAAKVLNVSQPTLSGQVAALEERHGTKLFDRRNRQVSLTENGRELFAVCQTIFGAIDEADDLLTGFGELSTGEWRISSDSPVHAVHLIAEFKRRWPGPKIDLATRNNGGVWDDLKHGLADMYIMGGKPPAGSYGSLRLARSPMTAIVSSTHPWASRKDVTLAELTDQNMLMREEGSITRAMFEKTVRGAGLELGMTTDIGSREALREAVALSLGIGVIFQCELGGDARITALKIVQPTIALEEHLVWSKDRGKTRMGRAMLEAARSVVAGQSGDGELFFQPRGVF